MSNKIQAATLPDYNPKREQYQIFIEGDLSVYITILDGVYHQACVKKPKFFKPLRVFKFGIDEIPEILLDPFTSILKEMFLIAGQPVYQEQAGFTMFADAKLLSSNVDSIKQTIDTIGTDRITAAIDAFIKLSDSVGPEGPSEKLDQVISSVKGAMKALDEASTHIKGKINEPCDSVTDVFSSIKNIFTGAAEGSKFLSIGAIVIACASCYYAYTSDNKYYYIVSAVAAIGAIMTCPAGIKKSIWSFLSSIFKFIPFVGNMFDDEEVHKEQIGMFDATTSITTLALGALGYASVGKSTLEKIKNVSYFKGTVSSLTDAFTYVASIFEKCIDYVCGKCGYSSTFRFFTTNIPEVELWYNQIKTLQKQMDLKELEMDMTNYNLILALEKESTTLLKKLPKNDVSAYVTHLFTTGGSTLRRLRDEFTRSSFAECGIRQEPVGILLMGVPGGGKSQLMQEIVARVLAKVLPPATHQTLRENPNKYIYNRCPSNEFWEGYTRDKYFCIFDEFMQKKEIAGGANPASSEIISAINQFPWPLHMATITEKANTNFCSTFVMGTTNHNMESLGRSFEAIHSAEAVIRRFDYIIDVSKDPDVPLLIIDGNTQFTSRNNILDVKQCNHGDLGVGIRSFDDIIDSIVKTYHMKSAWHKNKILYLRKSVDEAIDSTVAEPQSGYVTADESKYDGNYVNDIYEFCKITWPYDMPQLDGIDIDSPIFSNNVRRIISRMLELGSYRTTRFLCGRSVAQFIIKNQLLESITKVAYDDDFLSDSGIDCNIIEHKFFYWKKGLFKPLEKLAERAFGTIKNIEVSDTVKDWSKFLAALTGSVALIMFLNFVIKKFLKYMGWLWPLKKKARTLKSKILNPFSERWLYTFDKKTESYLAFCNPTQDEYTKAMQNQEEGVDEKHKAFFLNHCCPLFPECEKPVKVMRAGAKPLWTYILQQAGTTAEYFLELPYDVKHYQEDDEKGPLTWVTPHQMVFFFRDKKFVHVKPYQEQMGSYDTNCDDVVQKINTKCVYEIFSGARRLGQVLFIQGTIAIIPFHFVTYFVNLVKTEPQEAELLVITLSRPGATFKMGVLDIVKNVIYSGGDTDIEASRTTDWALIQFPTNIVHTHPTILKFFGRSGLYSRTANYPYTLERLRDGVRHSWGGKAKPLERPVPVQHDCGIKEMTRGFKYSGDFMEGDCGSVFFLKTKNSVLGFIFGIHVAGVPSQDSGISTAIFREDLEKLVALARKDAKVTMDLIPVTPFGIKEGVAIPQAGVELPPQFVPLYNTGVTVNAGMETRLVKTLLQDKFKKSEKAPALLRWKGDINPYKNALSRYCIRIVKFDKNLVRNCAKSYLNYMTVNSDKIVCKQLYSFDQAVMGDPLEPDFGAIARNTSAGFPFTSMPEFKGKGKSAFFGTDDSFDLKNPCCDKLRERVTEIITSASENKRLLHIATDFLKDELRPRQKVKEGKTRAVSGMAVDLLIAYRMYFGSFMVWMLKNRLNNGSAIGVNCYSKEWTALVEGLVDFGGQYNAYGSGDFSGFDGSEQPVVHWAIFDIIQDWYNDGKENEQVRRILWLEVVNSFHIRGNMIYEWFASLASGNAMTVNINTIYHNIVVRMVWAKHFGKDMRSIAEFDKQVHYIAYGDDGVFAVKPAYRDKFTELVLEKDLLELGLVYTSETKDSVNEYLRPLERVSFLKRSFAWNPLYRQYFAPLDMNTILESPQWTHKGEKFFEVLKERCQNSVDELSLHGPELFSTWASLIIYYLDQEYDIHLDRVTYDSCLGFIMSRDSPFARD